MVINLTPHNVVVRDENGREVTFPPSGTVARVTVQQTLDGDINGIPVLRNQYGAPEGLPDPQEGVWLIVSSLVLQAATDRSDLIAPDTSPQGVIRDESGRIVAVKRFVR